MGRLPRAENSTKVGWLWVCRVCRCERRVSLVDSALNVEGSRCMQDTPLEP